MQDLWKVHIVYPISTDVIKPFTFARSVGPPGDQNVRTYISGVTLSWTGGARPTMLCIPLVGVSRSERERIPPVVLSQRGGGVQHFLVLK